MREVTGHKNAASLASYSRADAKDRAKMAIAIDHEIQEAPATDSATHGFIAENWKLFRQRWENHVILSGLDERSDRFQVHRDLAPVQIDLANACMDSGKLSRKCEYPP